MGWEEKRNKGGRGGREREMGGEYCENTLYAFMNRHTKPIIVHSKYTLAKILNCDSTYFQSLSVELLCKYFLYSVEISP